MQGDRKWLHFGSKQDWWFHLIGRWAWEEEKSVFSAVVWKSGRPVPSVNVSERQANWNVCQGYHKKTSLSSVLCWIQPHWRVFKHLLKVMPRHLSHIQVQTVTRSLQSLRFVFLEPSRGGLGSSSCLRTQVSFSWRSRRLALSLTFFLFFFLVDIKIHGST